MQWAAIAEVTAWSVRVGSTGAWGLWAMAALLGGCSMMPADAGGPAARAQAAAIQVIRLERGCFGCVDAGVLELHRDGVAALTSHGNARRGIPERTNRGSLAPGDFDGLASLLIDLGFADLADSYGHPELRDGAWFTLSLAGKLPGKQVFSRVGAGPAALKQMVDAIEQTRSRIHFAP